MNLLQLQQVSLHFGSVKAVDNVSLDVQKGRFIALLGPSGCGKTTTLRLIAGFEWPDSGIITIKNRIVASETIQVAPEERRVGMVFQEYALFPHLDVAGNIAFGLRGADKYKRADELLALVGLPNHTKRMPHELSGGQQQRIALARALAPAPDILLLDEPFSNLDAALRIQVRAEVRSILKKSGTTCIFVTHDQEEALSLADEVAVMFNGQIAQMAEPQRLYTNPATRDIAAFVGEANFLPGEANGDRVDCVLGQLPLAQAAHGRVEVLIRPEALRLLDSGEPNAKITWREFYGHDQRIGIVLNDGSNLIVRADSSANYAVGQRVRIEASGIVRAFS
jgi:iron(III) transport system ATP-binding protein